MGKKQQEVDPEPVITIDDVSVPPMTMARKLQHLDPLWYHAKAELGDVKALISIRPYQDYQYLGGYILDERTDRIDEYAPGKMGKKQDARARALLDQLREQVQAALLAGGWERRWTTVHGKDLWLHDIALAGAGADVAGEDQACERELIDQAPDILPDLEVEDQVAPEPQRSHIVEVIGSKEAKERGQQPAYSRVVSTRLITFPCVVCHETVTQQRYPGHTPLYCGEGCKGEAQREKTRERVARYREQKKTAEDNPSQEHVTS